MTSRYNVDARAKFEYILKGKKFGGELHYWSIRTITNPDTKEVLGQIAYGYMNGMRTWRTSKVVKVSEIEGTKIVETQNSYYILAGEEADEATKNALYQTIYG